MGKTQITGMYANIGISSSGTPTTNYLPKFTGASTIGDSLIFNNGVNTYIGESGNSQGFWLKTNTTSGSAVEIGAYAFGTNSYGDLVFNTSDSANGRMRITAAGNVGIGTSSVVEGSQAASSISIFPVSSVSNGPLIQFAGNGRIRPASSGDRLSIEGNSLFLNPTFYTDVVIGGTGNYGTQTLSIRNAWAGGSYGQISFYTGTGNSAIRSNIPGNSTNGLQFLTYWSGNGDKVAAEFNGYGNVYNYNNSTTWQQTSDIRIKENIRPINNALDKLCALNPTHFEYKNNLGVTKTGFIAQEFEQVFAGHVHEGEPSDKFKEYFAEGEMMKSIDADLIPYLVAAIKELSAKVTALENK